MFRLKPHRLHLIAITTLACTFNVWPQEMHPDLPYPREAAKPGDACLSCNQTIVANGAAFVIRGRKVALHNEHVSDFVADSTRLLAQLQPRGALFQERAHGTTVMSEGGMGWFLFGLYVLVALVFAGMSGYAAVAKGLNPVSHFFIGLIFSALGYLYVLTRQRTAQSEAVPGGLVKVHATHEPVPCAKCGYTNHPAAKKCLGCGVELQPLVASEVKRRG